MHVPERWNIAIWDDGTIAGIYPVSGPQPAPRSDMRIVQVQPSPMRGAVSADALHYAEERFAVENDALRARVEQLEAENETLRRENGALMHDGSTQQIRDARARVEQLEAENARLMKLVEPKEWLGWDQVESIYDEARLLRKERDKARSRIEQLEAALRTLREEAELHPSLIRVLNEALDARR